MPATAAAPGLLLDPGRPQWEIVRERKEGTEMESRANAALKQLLRRHRQMINGRMPAPLYQVERRRFLRAHPHLKHELECAERAHRPSKLPGAKARRPGVGLGEATPARWRSGVANGQAAGSKPSPETINRLVALGVPLDLAERLPQREAEAMIARIQNAKPSEREEPQHTGSDRLQDFPPEDGEATDAQLRWIAGHIGGKYGTRHRKK